MSRSADNAAKSGHLRPLRRTPAHHPSQPLENRRSDGRNLRDYVIRHSHERASRYPRTASIQRTAGPPPTSRPLWIRSPRPRQSPCAGNASFSTFGQVVLRRCQVFIRYDEVLVPETSTSIVATSRSLSLSAATGMAMRSALPAGLPFRAKESEPMAFQAFAIGRPSCPPASRPTRDCGQRGNARFHGPH